MTGHIGLMRTCLWNFNVDKIVEQIKTDPGSRLNSRSAPILVLSAGFSIVYANDAALKFIGSTAEELVGTSLASINSPGKACIGDFQVHTPRRLVAELHLAVTIWNDEAAWMATLNGETDRVRAGGDRHLLASIVDSSDHAIISKTLDGTITSWNKGAEKLFGYSARRAIGRPVMMLFPSDRVDEELDILSEIAEGNRVPGFETVRIHQNGQLLHVIVSISPILDDSGAVIGASKIVSQVQRRGSVR